MQEIAENVCGLRDEMKQSGLRRRLTAFDAMTFVVSDMIGSGIFFTTGWVVLTITTGPALLGAWLLAGIFALLGALSYAELATLYPRAGGEYNYLREAYGPLWGFLSGWTSLFVGFSAPLAIGALGFATYLATLVPWASPDYVLVATPYFDLCGGTVVGVVLIATLMAGHFIRRGADSGMQAALTVVKITALVVLLVVAFTAGTGDIDHIFSSIPDKDLTLTAFVAGIVPITFSYSGWNASSYVAGEIKNPGRALPLSLVGGTLAVTVLYVLVNVVYLYALPIEQISGIGPIAEKAMTALLGPLGGSLIAVVIALCILGAMNTMLFIGARVLYAMGRDGLFFQFASRVDSRTDAPGRSVVVLGSVAIVMVIVGELRSLLEFAGFVLIVFNFLAVFSIFVLRRRVPDLPRPYRAWGYPVTPALFCGFSVYLMISSFLYNLNSTLAGLGVVVLGAVYYYAHRLNRRRSTSPSG